MGRELVEGQERELNVRLRGEQRLLYGIFRGSSLLPVERKDPLRLLGEVAKLKTLSQ